MWIKDINGNLINLDYVAKIKKTDRENPDRDSLIEVVMDDGEIVCVMSNCSGYVEEAMRALEQSLEAINLEDLHWDAYED